MKKAVSQIMTTNVLPTVIQILTLVSYFDLTPLLPSPPFSSQRFYVLHSGKLFEQSQNKNTCMGTDSTVTLADVAEWFTHNDVVVSVEGLACS